MDESKIERIDLYSEILNKEMSILAYLPKNYDELDSLPVLYFFHGRTGCEDIMLSLDIASKADKMIESGEIKPIIIVCPRMDNSRGLNSALNCEILINSNDNRVMNLGRYEDYFINEIIPLIDKKFNTIKDRNSRYIGGVSAGGYIALHNIFRHIDMFSKVGGHMPALELKLEKDDELHYKEVGLWEKYNPIDIANQMTFDAEIQVYLDAGDEDEGNFFEGCAILNDILKEKNIDSQNYIFSGHHNEAYIKSNLEKYLKFYGND